MRLYSLVGYISFQPLPIDPAVPHVEQTSLLASLVYETRKIFYVVFSMSDQVSERKSLLYGA